MASKRLISGARLGGWTLQQLLGQGGNGVVWQCEDAGHRSGAIKLLKSYFLEPTKEPGEQVHRTRRTQRFLDEIRFLQAQNGRSGVIPILDSFVPEKPSEEMRPWVVMPLAVPLPEWLESDTMTLRRVVEVFKVVAQTLSALHAEGTYHRDIKPDNILMLDASPRLADFGLVDFVGKGSNTSNGEILGPIFYVAPEMRANAPESGGGPADVYSLAKAFWVASTRQKYPLPGEQRLSVEAMTLSANVSDPRARILDVILDRATRHTPGERPTMREFAEELSAWLSAPPVHPIASQHFSELSKRIKPGQEVRAEQLAQETDLQRQVCGIRDMLVDKLNAGLTNLAKLNLLDWKLNPLPPRLINNGNRLPFTWGEWDLHTLGKPPATRDCVWNCCVTLFQQVCAPPDRTFAYEGGFVLEIDPTKLLNITAAHRFGSINSDMANVTTWRYQCSLEVGTAKSEVAIVQLLNDFQGHLPEAVEQFLKMSGIIG